MALWVAMYKRVQSKFSLHISVFIGNDGCAVVFARLTGFIDRTEFFNYLGLIRAFTL